MTWWREQIRRGMNARTFALVAILLLTLVWIGVMDRRAAALKARGRAAAASVAPGPAQPSAAEPALRQALLAGVSAGWGSDPFGRRIPAPGDEGRARSASPAPGRAGARPAGLYLQGVMAGPLGRSALINGSVYREGERIGALEVLQIGQKSVLLLDHGTVTTLRLQGERP